MAPTTLTQTAHPVRIGARPDRHSPMLVAFRGRHANATVPGRRVTRFVVEFHDREQREH